MSRQRSRSPAGIARATRRYLVRMLVTELREYVLEADSRADAREKAESLDTGTDYVTLDTTNWSVEHVEVDD